MLKFELKNLHIIGTNTSTRLLTRTDCADPINFVLSLPFFISHYHITFFIFQHDTVSIVSDESETNETPRTPISVSHVNFYEDRDSPDPVSPSALSSVLSPTSSDTPDPPEEEQSSSPPTPTPTTELAPRSTPLRSLFLDEVVWQIDENVFAAAIDAVNNNSLMCRLNIEFICEIADENADHVQEAR